MRVFRRQRGIDNRHGIGVQHLLNEYILGGCCVSSAGVIAVNKRVRNPRPYKSAILTLFLMLHEFEQVT